MRAQLEHGVRNLSLSTALSPGSLCESDEHVLFRDSHL